MSTAPLYAAILIGGKSRRMGEPKHLLTASAAPPASSAKNMAIEQKALQSSTWLERTITLLQPLATQTVIVGAGTLPASCKNIVRIDDITGAAGPLAGILAAMRFAPLANWLVLACDMPAVSKESLTWLLYQRKILQYGSEECWGIVPRLCDNGYVEPLFALYYHQAKTLFEQQYQQKKLKIGLVAQYPQIATPIVPSELAAAWQNINTPEQLRCFTKS